jgi:glycosyltransferase involved in cell wall biosynthesis
VMKELNDAQANCLAEGLPPPLRVCYFGTYRTEYSRNQIMIEGLRRAGVEVFECSVQLWQGIEDRVDAASGGWLKPAFWMRFAKAYIKLLKKYRQVGPYDVLIIGYPGQIDVFLGRLLSWMRGKPLVWDIFMSIYLISFERGLHQRSPFTIRLLRVLEWAACRLPDRLILDTQQYVKWFEEIHGINPRRFRLVPTGADDRIFQPGQKIENASETFRVLYYGTFIPNHGVEQIVEAAHLLSENKDIHFEMVGDGPDKENAQAMAEACRLTNLTFLDWMDREALAHKIAQADVCLGAFGNTPQSLMTVQNKIYEGLAMGKAVVSGDSDAVRDALQHGEEVYLCERNNPASLAQAVLRLKNQPELQRKLEENGYCAFQLKYSLHKNGQRFAAHLLELTGHPGQIRKQAA